MLLAVLPIISLKVLEELAGALAALGFGAVGKLLVQREATTLRKGFFPYSTSAPSDADSIVISGSSFCPVTTFELHPFL